MMADQILIEETSCFNIVILHFLLSSFPIYLIITIIVLRKEAIYVAFIIEYTNIKVVI